MPDKWGRYPGDPSYGIDPNGGSGGGTDPNSKYFGGGTTNTHSDIDNLLRQRGYNIPYSTEDMYNLIGTLLSRGDPSYHRGAPMSEVGSLNDPNAPGDNYSQALDKIVGMLSGKLGRVGAGPTTGINDRQAWTAYSQDALGAGPTQEYQNVFADNYKSEAQGGKASPFDQFVQKQEPYLQNQYLANAYQKFSQPGVMDNIKDAYNQLQGKTNRANAAAANGEDQGVVPSFEDYIKGQVSNDYTNFLQQQKPGLATAFEMASPLERYGYHQSKALEGASAPRIL